MKTLNEIELNSHIEKLCGINTGLRKTDFLNHIADKKTIFDNLVKGQVNADMFLFRLNSVSDHKSVDPDALQHFEVGQVVTYVDSDGCAYPNMQIIGFKVDSYGRSVYLNRESYWCPVHSKLLVLQDGWITANQEQINAIDDVLIKPFKPFNYEVLKRTYELESKGST